ncbi:hypothetical protein N4R57_10065 [Rhodobacteraceae bacterium D3-12]|nr:hypothetical protein N4R57_10065 [Rhodobacteraceae bacterium D3-12]
MRKPLLALLLATMTLTACGTVRDSAFNPFNWFGRSRGEALPQEGSTNPLIPNKRGGVFARRGPEVYAGTPVAVIKELVVERAAGGAIVRVKGVANRQGPFEVRMVKDDDAKDGTLSYTLKALQTPTRIVGPETGRELVAAQFVPDADLAGIRTIRVKGAQNARSTSRGRF